MEEQHGEKCLLEFRANGAKWADYVNSQRENYKINGTG